MALLAILAYSTKDGINVALQVPVDLYDPGPFKELAKAIIAYRLKYHKAPRQQLPIIVDELPLAKEQIKTARLIAAKFGNEIRKMNRAYVIDLARTFAIRQNFKKQLLAGAQEAHKRHGDNEVVRKLVYDALMYAPDNVDMGIKLSDTERSLAWLNQEDIVYPIGIEPFDKGGVGLVPKGLTLYLAGKGTGKSWSCVHIGRQMMKLGFKVLHVSLEMSDIKVAKRYHQSFNAMSRNYDKFVRPVFERNKKGEIVDFDVKLNKPKLAQTSPNIRRTLEKRIELWKTEFRNLTIKEWPSGKLTMPTLVHYLDQLTSVDEFDPDVIIVDYPDLFKINPANQRLEVGAVVVELRGIASERNLAMFTPSQINRIGMSAELVKSVHTSEAMLKVNTADTVLTYSRTDIEKANNIARLYANHVRDAGDGMEIIISQSYTTGQFVIDAHDMNKNLREAMEKKAEAAGATPTEEPEEKGTLI